MARNRMLSPEFWLDEELAGLSPHARLLYMGLWGICDDNYATLPNKAGWIKAQVFPYESVDIHRLLGELSESTHLLLFQENGEQFWYIRNFFKHQKVERPSKPKYPKYEPEKRVLGEPSVSPLPEVKLSKEKLKEDKHFPTENQAMPGGQKIEISVLSGNSPTPKVPAAPLPEYGRKEINEMLLALKTKIGIDAFVDSAIERNMAKHCVALLEKLGKDEFVRRLEVLMADPFHAKNFNKIKYVYNNVKGFIEPKSNIAFIS